MSIEEAASGGPEWCEAPGDWFTCPTCDAGLYWADLGHGELLICANPQCFATGTPVPIWLAQQQREDRGLDAPVSGPGWPRPILEGRPVAYLTPVTAGHPWWRLTHRERLLTCQNEWCCQVCGQTLEPRAWVLVDGQGDVDSDAAMHDRCLRLATAVCPHLISESSTLRAVQVQRNQIHGDGLPLRRGDAWTPQRWSVPTACMSPS